MFRVKSSITATPAPRSPMDFWSNSKPRSPRALCWPSFRTEGAWPPHQSFSSGWVVWSVCLSSWSPLVSPPASFRSRGRAQSPAPSWRSAVGLLLVLALLAGRRRPLGLAGIRQGRLAVGHAPGPVQLLLPDVHLGERPRLVGPGLVARARVAVGGHGVVVGQVVRVQRRLLAGQPVGNRGEGGGLVRLFGCGLGLVRILQDQLHLVGAPGGQGRIHLGHEGDAPGGERQHQVQQQRHPEGPDDDPVLAQCLRLPALRPRPRRLPI